MLSWFETAILLLLLHAATLTAAIILYKRLTAYRIAAARLRHQLQIKKRELSELLDCMSEGVVVYDEHMRFVLCNRRFREIYKKTASALVPGRTLAEILRHGVSAGQWPDALGREEEWIAERLAVQLDTEREMLTQVDGKCWILVRNRPWPSGGTIGIRADITEFENAKREAQEKSRELEKVAMAAEYEALHDPLTGLANRRYLEREMTRRTGDILKREGFAFLHVDLDRFKQINDTLGHAAGDFILKHVAEVLSQTTRFGDFMARIGGDEFVVLTASDGARAPLERLATRIIDRLSEPISYKGNLCHFGASVGIAIGIACSVDEEIDSERLMHNADIALYRAKGMGRGCYEFFDQYLGDDAEETNALSEQLVEAVANEAFFPVYQPQYEAVTGQLRGVQALPRWKHDTAGELPPSIFADLAAKLGLSGQIDRIILRKALDDLAVWGALGLDVPRLAISLSVNRLNEMEMPRTLERLPIPTGRLSFEIRESVFTNTSEADREAIAQLKRAGVDVEMSEFGTSYGSLIGLLSFAPKRLKISPEFVAPLPDSDGHASLVRSIINMAHSLKMEVTAEGVDHAAQRDMLEALGCDCLQGRFFAFPMPSGSLVNLLSRSSVPAQPHVVSAAR